MPIYEYTCECGKVFDTIQKMSDAPLTQCRCENAGKVTKNLTAAGFALKGSGWYVTDFRGGAAATAKPAEGKTEGKTEGKADGKSDAKPADASAPAAAPATPAAATPAAAPAAAPATTAGTSN
jgi:putative FmdB family regulatory protein